MKLFPLLIGATTACSGIGIAAPPEWHFENSGGVPNKLVWQTELGPSYYLFQSQDLRDWTYVPTFPQPGSGGAMEHPFTTGTRGFFKIIAAPPAPAGFAYIPAGLFQMGDQSNPLVAYSDNLPVHSVWVSAFYMAKHEVPDGWWHAVRAWGLSNGYDLPAGNGFYGSKGAYYPVHSISWHAMVRWCNARSQMENLAPCYRVSGAIYKGNLDNNAVVCDFGANGYRLPTEAEWEKAARGGLVGSRFPWGNIITHSQANYYSSSSYSYDVSPTRGYHPTYNDGVTPYTSPVGSFAPNGYGLYDMAGNVWEWCWDWYGVSYYTTSSGTDPRGPDSGFLSRVARGGCWSSDANNCRAANRFNNSPVFSDYHMGFRPVRSSVP